MGIMVENKLPIKNRNDSAYWELTLFAVWILLLTIGAHALSTTANTNYFNLQQGSNYPLTLNVSVEKAGNINFDYTTTSSDITLSFDSGVRKILYPVSFSVPMTIKVGNNASPGLHKAYIKINSDSEGMITRNLSILVYKSTGTIYKNVEASTLSPNPIVLTINPSSNIDLERNKQARIDITVSNDMHDSSSNYWVFLNKDFADLKVQVLNGSSINDLSFESRHQVTILIDSNSTTNFGLHSFEVVMSESSSGRAKKLAIANIYVKKSSESSIKESNLNVETTFDKSKTVSFTVKNSDSFAKEFSITTQGEIIELSDNEQKVIKLNPLEEKVISVNVIPFKAKINGAVARITIDDNYSKEIINLKVNITDFEQKTKGVDFNQITVGFVGLANSLTNGLTGKMSLSSPMILFGLIIIAALLAVNVISKVKKRSAIEKAVKKLDRLEIRIKPASKKWAYTAS